jgi:hypothetical protein
MTESVQDLQTLVSGARAEIAACSSSEDLEQIRVRLLGKKVVLSANIMYIVVLVE